jgi:subtilisin family serine protease
MEHALPGPNGTARSQRVVFAACAPLLAVITFAVVDLHAAFAATPTGNGITVAVLSTGIDRDHPDLSDSVVAEHCFCRDANGDGCCPDGSTEQDGPGSAADDSGEGTYIAGIVTADGSVAPRGGAPDAQIVAVKVLDADATFASSAQVVAGLDWILDQRPDVRIVAVGLTSAALFAGDCGSLEPPDATAAAFARVIDALTARGVLVVAPSGDQCSGMHMAAPACVANALSVGAVYDRSRDFQRFPVICEGAVDGCADQNIEADDVPCFSNSNATTDVFAPGVFVTSTWLEGGVLTASGTLAAAGTVTACAATLLEVAVNLEPDELETLLESSTTLVMDETNGLSFPRLDCAQSLAPLLPTASPTPTAPTPTATPSPSLAQPLCTGDCDASGRVAVNEIVTLVNIVLDKAAPSACPHGISGGSAVDIALLVRSVNNSLIGCGG